MIPRATSSGVLVPTPGGSTAPESANMPAPRTIPGNTHETPTPCSSRSCRSPSEKPRSPYFVAEYSDDCGEAVLPDSDETNTR